MSCLKTMPETRHIPIIVLTGQPNGHMRRQLRYLGAEEYLAKPIEFEVLRDVVASFIDLGFCGKLRDVSREDAVKRPDY